MKKRIIILLILSSIFLLIVSCTKNDCEQFGEQDKIDECYLKSFACEKIKIGSIKDLCYNDLAIKNQDINLCNKLTNPYFCFKKISELTNNVSICFNITDINWKDFCLKTYAEKNSGFELCNQITEIELKNDCLINVSSMLNNEKICEDIELLYRCNEAPKLSCITVYTAQFDCYAPIALSKKDVEICKKIKDLIFRSQCIKDLAVQEKDPAICNIIEFNPIKEKCLVKAKTDM